MSGGPQNMPTHLPAKLQSQFFHILCLTSRRKYLASNVRRRYRSDRWQVWIHAHQSIHVDCRYWCWCSSSLVNYHYFNLFDLISLPLKLIIFKFTYKYLFSSHIFLEFSISNSHFRSTVIQYFCTNGAAYHTAAVTFR